MMHINRKFNVMKLESFKALAKILFNGTQCLCTGFQLGYFIFLNDSFSEDGAQEYAVIKHGVQIDSLTVSWMESERELIDSFNDLATIPSPMVSEIENLKLDYEPGHSCYLCN